MTEKVHELFLNYACNAKCGFCYNPPITPELLRRELPLHEAAKSLYQGARDGARALNIHGGEVTLRDDLPQTLALARRLGYRRITIITNGVLLDDESAVRKLRDCGATHFRISIHAAGPRIHDEILGVPGAFERASKAMRHMKALGLPVGLNFVLDSRNFREVPGFLKRFCLEEAVSDVIVYFPHLRGMMLINADRIGVSYSEVLPFVREGAGLLRREGRLAALALANFTPCLLPELRPLMLDWRKEPGPASSMTHPEGFTDDIAGMKEGQKTLVPACRRCELAESCLGVEREYVERRGDKEFAPLEAAAR